jgi:hypothetical protein
LFLIETKRTKKEMEWIRLKLGFDNLFVVDPIRRRDWLALLWSKECSLSIQNIFLRHISATFLLEDEGLEWKLTCFYGHPKVGKRHECWEVLKYLKSCSPSPWLRVWDFNEIVDNSEKWGAAWRKEEQMEQFRGCLEECQLSDLGFIGPKYTWTNAREDGNFTKVRLDKPLANKEWCMAFKEMTVHVLAARSSNHKPVMITFRGHDILRFASKKSFQFEAKWLLDDEHYEVVGEAWGHGSGAISAMADVTKKLSTCSGALSKWSYVKHGTAAKALKEKTDQLAKLQKYKGPYNQGPIRLLKKEIALIIDQEELKWKQMAKKKNWLTKGDPDTPFFHAWANQRRQNNKITCIMEENGQVNKEQAEI